MDCSSEGSLTVDNFARSKDIRSRCRGLLITFDMLPDDVLLEIFDFYLDEDIRFFEKEWIALAHVCRRWRSLVFQSPHRLNLRLMCTPYTRVWETLDIWPPLPLVITNSVMDEITSVGNIIAALEHSDRVCQINLDLKASELESVTYSAAIQKPFLELKDLQLGIYDKLGPEPILPDSFLAGTAPRLCSLKLNSVSFPRLPELLLSITHLVCLDLRNIPPSGYIPPEAMATGLSALTSLEFLCLHYLSPRPRPVLESRHQTPPPLTCSILPGLIIIKFNGDSEYLEKILARIDAPRVKNLDITFFKQIMFDTPQLFQFISRRPTLRAPEMGCINFNFRTTIVKFQSRTSEFSDVRVEFPCTASEWQLLSLEQTCASSLPLISTLKDLSICGDRLYLPPHWQDDVSNTLWLVLLRPFAAVTNLYLSKNSARCIAPVLQELVGGRTTEVLPALDNIFLDGFSPSGPLHEGIEKFVAARRLTSHPVAVSPVDEGHREVLRWY